MRTAILLAFVVGVCWLQRQAELPSAAALTALAAGAVLLLAGAALSVGRVPRAMRIAMAAFAACIAGFVYASTQSALRLADALSAADEGRDIVVEGVVASLPMRLDRGVRFEFDVERVLSPDTRVPARVLLGWYTNVPPLRPAERWRFTVRLKRPHGAQNPGGFDLEAWLLERDLRATGAVRMARSVPAPLRVDRLVGQPRALVERARFDLRERLAPLLDGKRYGGVVMALVLGDQRAISAFDWSLFSRAGIAHLVSISGLHITMIAALAGWCAAAVWRRTPALLVRGAAQTAGVLAGLLAAFSYALIAGWGIPAQRTVLMLAVVAVAWLARARIGLGASLALAAAVVCLFDPWAVLAAGFWLSFGAVAAIVWVVQGRLPPMQWPAWRRAMTTAVRVQLAVTLALVPATILLFHQVSLISPFANAVAIPVVSWLVTPLALAGGALAWMPAPFDAPAAALLGLAHALFGWLAEGLAIAAELPVASVAAATPPGAVIALAVAGIAWLLAPPGWPARGAGALLALPLFVWPPERPAAGELWVTALDVGQGSAVLLETRDRAWLHDAGPRYSSDSDAGERIVLPYLRHRGIRALDGLVVSHLDSDHAGGAAAVLRGMPARRLISSIAAGDAALAGRTPERCLAGERWTDGELELTMLHPSAADYAVSRSTNAMSCVLLARVGAVRALLTGDISAAEESVLVARWPALRVDWLAAPHHGSRTSSSEAFLALLAARHAVAQAGYRNRYGHPDAGVVARYGTYAISLARTDVSGALQWRFGADGRVRLDAWRLVAARYWHTRHLAPPMPDGAGADDTGDEALEPTPIEPFIAG
jgi:competence protein ComEC